MLEGADTTGYQSLRDFGSSSPEFPPVDEDTPEQLEIKARIDEALSGTDDGKEA
jgi:hypothetical protein